MLRAQRLKVGPQWIRYRSQESPKSATVLQIPSGGRVCKHHHLVPSMTNQSNLLHPGTTACARSCAEAPPPAHCCFLVSFFPLSVFFPTSSKAIWRQPNGLAAGALRASLQRYIVLFIHSSYRTLPSTHCRGYLKRL